MQAPAAQPRVADGVARALPVGLAVLVDGVAFGVLARAAGLDAAAVVVMSAVVYSGSAQYAGLSVIRSGGSPAAAAAAALLLNLRVVPMGLSLAGELRGRRPRRALEAQLVTDESWALSRSGDGRWQRRLLIGSGLVMWIAWVGGTSAGALAGGVVPAGPPTLGLDAAYPAAFLALLVPLLREPGARTAAAAGAVVALGLTPLLPPGGALLAAALAPAGVAPVRRLLARRRSGR